MALASALNITTASKAETFLHIRDFLASQNGIADYSQTGAGYQIVDSRYASGDPATPATDDWCVLQSNGENATWPLYYRLIFDYSTTLSIRIYLGWNATTHSGFAETYYDKNINSGNAGCTLHLHADLDECHLLTQPGSTGNLYWSPFFRLGAGQTLYSGQAVQMPDTIQAYTTETVLTLPSGADWPDWAQAGKILQNWDATTMQTLTLTAANKANKTITVASSAAMQAGSWLVEDLCVGVPSKYSSNAASSSTLMINPNRFGQLSAMQESRIFSKIAVLGLDKKYNERLTAPITVGGNAGIRGQFKLAFETSVPAAQCEAWHDPTTGQDYRLYTVYSNAYIAIREA